MPKAANRPDRPGQIKRQEYNKMQGQGRTFVSGFYKSREWKLARVNQLMNQPLCEHCNIQGIIKEANTVDHIKSVNQKDPYDTQGGRYGDPLDPENLQSLCEKCHNKKSAKERWGKV